MCENITFPHTTYAGGNYSDTFRVYDIRKKLHVARRTSRFQRSVFRRKIYFPSCAHTFHITMEFSYLGPKFESLNHMLPEKPSGRHGDQASVWFGHWMYHVLFIPMWQYFIYNNFYTFHATNNLRSIGNHLLFLSNKKFEHVIYSPIKLCITFFPTRAFNSDDFPTFG